MSPGPRDDEDRLCHQVPASLQDATFAGQDTAPASNIGNGIQEHRIAEPSDQNGFASRIEFEQRAEADTVNVSAANLEAPVEDSFMIDEPPAEEDVLQTEQQTHMDLEYLKPLSSPVWVDYISDFIAVTRPLHTSLLSHAVKNRKPEGPALTTLERVIYSTNMALIAQWNLSHSAVQEIVV
ncbi:hypothetical protein NliqN6_5911 [Naganishia liquefaciens]|uniref:Uncharacterized protein n=1 Tax=Naganishia liquefaciens TaxID=104408 RepID=A0A8H3U0F8_9TREE|nr:hypothetical protein NliqN6_5911 [Naganishia liquefaciens]